MFKLNYNLFRRMGRNTYETVLQINAGKLTLDSDRTSVFLLEFEWDICGKYNHFSTDHFYIHICLILVKATEW